MKENIFIFLLPQTNQIFADNVLIIIDDSIDNRTIYNYIPNVNYTIKELETFIVSGVNVGFILKEEKNKKALDPRLAGHDPTAPWQAAECYYNGFRRTGGVLITAGLKRQCL